ncbi:MAG: 6-carboxytetrahydropterin synthase QueD [Chitinispirillales bacterium]|jgi:6-pyruvoyltetrahydropterin/6-carboxytetrahydropterin synthase|nr:6-carboxytetrahydropterin synthase QueD [Chitinispirillales bacterium]
MYEITTQQHFSAAHRLLHYEGPCENLHGHNWLVRATVKCENLDKSGIAIDFKILKRKLKDILSEFDHKNLNDIFDALNQSPSSERIACYVYHKLADSLSEDGHDARVTRVEVEETPGNCAAYYE